MDLFLVTLSLRAFNLGSKSVFVTRFVTSGILFLTAVNAELVANLLTSGILFSTAVNAELVANLLISEILFSTAVNAPLVANPLTQGILPSTSVILELRSVFLARSLTSGIFLSILLILSSKSDPSFSYLVLKTKIVVSIPFTFATNLSYSVFLYNIIFDNIA